MRALSKPLFFSLSWRDPRRLYGYNLDMYNDLLAKLAGQCEWQGLGDFAFCDGDLDMFMFMMRYPSFEMLRRYPVRYVPPPSWLIGEYPPKENKSPTNKGEEKERMPNYLITITHPDPADDYTMSGPLKYIRKLTLSEWNKLKGSMNAWEQVFGITPPSCEHPAKETQEDLAKAYAAWEDALERNFTVRDCCEILSYGGKGFTIQREIKEK